MSDLKKAITEKAVSEAALKAIETDIREARNKIIREIVRTLGIGEPLISVDGKLGYISRVDVFFNGGLSVFFTDTGPSNLAPHRVRSYDEPSGNGRVIRDDDLLTFLRDWRRAQPASGDTE